MKKVFIILILFFCHLSVAIPGGKSSHRKKSYRSKLSIQKVAKKDLSSKRKPSSLVPRRLNSQVRHWVHHFTKSEKGRIGNFFFKGSKYKKIIQAMLVDNNLPKELYYLAILESGFKIDARSHAGAMGTWQFMKPTALENGLMVTQSVDERLDPMRSTIAAMKYLRSLKRRYGDWKLALAAYNCGPKRVNRAIRIAGRNFWKISKRKLLPRETRNYIPQFLAISYIGQNPRKYGFRENSVRFHKLAELIYLPSPLRLSDLAKITGLSHKKLKKLNPHLKKGITPLWKKSYGVWVPKKYGKRVASLRPRLARKVVLERKFWRGRSKRFNLQSSKLPKKYKVKSGDNLSQIAKRFQISTKKLMKANGLRSDRLLAGQHLVISAAKN